MKTIAVSDATHHALMQRKLDTGASSIEAVIAASLSVGARQRFDARRRDVDSVCRRHRVVRLRMFGSARHGRDGPDSDIDLIVDFAADARPGLFGLGELRADLEVVLGCAVDITTEAGLHRRLRGAILADAVEVWHA